MIFSGLNTRSISTQSGGVLGIRVNFENEVGDFAIGFTGDSFFGVSSSNGILSINNNDFGTINNESRDFKIIYSNDIFNLYQGEQILINGGSKELDQYESLLVYSDKTIDCDIYVSGKEPVLNFSTLNLSNSGNNIISGLLSNAFPDRRFKIFEASVDVNSSSKFAITGWDTGVCDEECFVNLVSLENFPTPASGVKIDFQSNFGPFSVRTDIGTSFVGSSEVFSVSPNQNTFFSSAGSKLFNVTSFFQGPNRNLRVELEYVSGGLSSQLRSLESGIISGEISGVIKGCGTLSRSAVNFLSEVEGLSGYTFSGDASGQVSQQFCHTGQVVWSGNLLRSGIIPSGSQSGQIYHDYLPLNLTGTVLDGSGYYVFQGAYLGNVDSGSVNIPVTGNLLHTGYLYSSEGRIAGIGVSNILETRTTEICGSYNGAGYITQSKNYFFNEDGWSGLIPTTFQAYYIPSGPYSENLSVIGSGLIPNSSSYFSGSVSGLASGFINSETGCDTLTGLITGLHSFEVIECIEQSGVFAGDVAPSVTNLLDYYGNQTGRLYEFNFSTFQNYLVGSGKPCSVYFSGFVYEMDPFKTVKDIGEIALKITDRQNGAIIQTGFLNEFVRTETQEVGIYEFRDYPVYRRNFSNLTGFDFTGDINIYGSFQTTEVGLDPIYDTNYLRLLIYPYSSGVSSGTAPITGHYEISRCLTGNACVTGTGLVDGQVSGLYTLLNGTGIGSGVMLGPIVPIDFVDMWDLKTGIGQTSRDYKSSGWYEGGMSGKFTNPDGGMVTRQNIFNTPFIEVYYNRSLNLDSSIAKLSVFDGYNLEEILISGK
jgi:hypothetical protein